MLGVVYAERQRQKEKEKDGDREREREREMERERWRKIKAILTQTGHNLLAKQESEFQEFIQHKGNQQYCTISYTPF